MRSRRRIRPYLALVTPAPVLITESADEFSRLCAALRDELKPQGAVEQFLVDEIAELMWEIRRYRRAKITLINSAYRDALEKVLERVFREPGQRVVDIEEDTDELAHQWFSDQSAKQLILEKLAYFGLDEHAIEAEAMGIIAPVLEKLDQLLVSREWRLDKILRSLAEFRGGLGRQLRATVERLIDGEVVALGNTSEKRPPAAA